jgi:DNA invertase Pin-like site-specific DNA recombinase
MTKESAPLPFVRYARVSRVGGRSGDGYISIPEQVRTMDGVAERHGVEVFPGVFEDQDRSGGNMDRPEFQRALGLVRDGKAGGIIVATFDRFSRDEADTFSSIGEIENLGGRLLCGDGDVSMATSHDAMQTGIRTVFNAFERRRKREGLNAAVRNAIGRGVHLSVPFGYERSNGKGTPLAINEDEAPAVRLAFQLRADGHSWQAVADALNASGIMPRPYKRHGVVKQAVWTFKTARQLIVGRQEDGIGNAVYLGTAWNGEHITPDAHPALVSEELMRAAADARGTKPIGPDEGYLLSGLVRCKSCGYAMTYNGRDFLRCRSAQHGDGRCPDPVGVNARQLEAVVVADFKRRIRGTVEVEGDQADDAVIAASAEARRLAMRHANTVAMMPDDLSGAAGENWRDRERADREALQAAERHEREAKSRARGANLPDDLTADNFDSWPIPDRRTFLAALFAAVVVHKPERWRQPVPERVRVILRDQAPTNSTALIAHVAAA